jgi:pantoate--beta-alanine ligase
VSTLRAFSEPDTLRCALDAARAAGRRIGVVPTMGALHEGHASLVARAAGECDEVVVTIFVNPLQFGDPNDLDRYPRSEDADLAACDAAGATMAFVPSVGTVYPTWPDPPLATVSVRGLTEAWEGRSRPGHFTGVATVVAKLLALCAPCRAYFGEKDFQQLAVVRAMVADLWLPVEVCGCPTIREVDGLALSSRNRRLSPEGRRRAAVLFRALEAGRALVEAGPGPADAAVEAMGRVLAEEPAVTPDYAVVVDPLYLTVPDALLPGATYRLLVAAELEGVRLIDNVGAAVPAGTLVGDPEPVPMATRGAGI